jgi:hypothetical protein
MTAAVSTFPNDDLVSLASREKLREELARAVADRDAAMQLAEEAEARASEALEQVHGYVRTVDLLHAEISVNAVAMRVVDEALKAAETDCEGFRSILRAIASGRLTAAETLSIAREAAKGSQRNR